MIGPRTRGRARRGFPSMTKVPLTARGAEQLRSELEQLKRVERPRVIEAIAEARAHGDLKENAEYHAAREQQGFIEGRIKDIEGKLSHAEIIDVTRLPQNGKVVFGTTVDVLELDKDRSTPSSSSATTRPISSRARSASARRSPAPDRQERGRCRAGGRPRRQRELEQRFVQRITIENGKIKQIESSGYGY
jgi:hypothetical protein